MIAGLRGLVGDSENATTGFLPHPIALQLFGRHQRLRDEYRLPRAESLIAQRKMSHAESVLVMDGSKGEFRRVNPLRAAPELLLVDPYVANALVSCQEFHDAESSAIIGN